MVGNNEEHIVNTAADADILREIYCEEENYRDSLGVQFDVNRSGKRSKYVGVLQRK